MNQILYESELIRIGVFTLSTHDKSFNQPGFIKNPHMVFPKNSIWIKHENKPAFIADTFLVNLYNEEQCYERACIHPDGDFCH